MMLGALTQEISKLPWVNACFFGLQTLLTCIALTLGDSADVRARFETPLTPATFAFSIWNAIYLLCMILLITDVSYAGLSLYDSAAKPNSLRLCFAASCIANGAWCIALASGHVVSATLLVSLLWVTLLPLYVFASYERHLQAFVWREYLCSELCVRVYFAWITVEMAVSWAMTMQLRAGAVLPLSTCLSVLALLIVAALSGLAHGRDPVMALVVAWALLGVTSKNATSFDRNEFAQVQSAATLGAGVLAAMALVSCSYWLGELNWTPKLESPRPRRLSRLSVASNRDEYGSIRIVSP